MSKKLEDVDQSAWDAARKPARFALAGPGFRTEAALRQGEVLVRTAIARAIMTATAEKPDRCAALLREADKLIIWEHTPLPSDFQERVERALS